jgi:low affinity Fe/Cu permease
MGSRDDDFKVVATYLAYFMGGLLLLYIIWQVIVLCMAFLSAT